jgi:hypothetical protein
MFSFFFGLWDSFIFWSWEHYIPHVIFLIGVISGVISLKLKKTVKKAGE